MLHKEVKVGYRFRLLKSIDIGMYLLGTIGATGIVTEMNDLEIYATMDKPDPQLKEQDNRLHFGSVDLGADFCEDDEFDISAKEYFLRYTEPV